MQRPDECSTLTHFPEVSWAFLTPWRLFLKNAGEAKHIESDDDGPCTEHEHPAEQAHSIFHMVPHGVPHDAR